MTDDPRLLLAALDQVPFILAVCEGPELRVLSLSAATRAVLPGRDWAGRPIREVISDLLDQQIVDRYYEVYRTGEPENGREWRVHLDMPDGSVHEMYASFTITPWHAPSGERLGVIGVGFDVTESVRQRQAAGALRRQVEQSRQVITSLQRALLPTGLPVLPGVQVAASYLLADADTAAGGDWFDAAARPGGRVALIVGDVVGHGVSASGVMGQLRAVLRDRLDDGAGIADALAAADRFASRTPGAHATTVGIAELDPVSGDLVYCMAGHPPPLVVSPSGETRFLSGTGGTPLATGGSFPVATDRLAPGELLLLYTDGVLERPGRTHATGAAELASVAASCAAGRALRDPGSTAAERVCTQAVELLVRATGHHDDITLLAAQRVPAPSPLVLDLPVTPESLADARGAIGSWLATIGVTAHDGFVVQHALGELMTNAIEHARSASMVEVRGSLLPSGRLALTVRDHGEWRAPTPDPNRGRGLAMASQLVDELSVEPSSPGTLASVTHTLVRPALLLDLSGLSGFSEPLGLAAPSSGTFRIVEEAGDETRVRIEGPVDASTAAVARQELLRRGRGGTVALTVDLSAVTHLSSAGVSALHQVAERHASPSAPLSLHASPGTPAREILELVALPSLA
ncbi:SpoIIE family protein phosphatase [Actinoplanes sp. CA-030573]|uniref:SpoIIE family protein phosphatase n=1 Tax=Actinoplanes sp. CA-030573 TaxID=3239898 RepID=UPI003D90EC29